MASHKRKHEDALRHLFRSEQLVTLINRLGHCETYRFTLELETAVAEAMDQCSSVLSSQIVLHSSAPSIFHSEFDNFDTFISTLEGQSSVHTAHGIMLQEVSGEEHGGTTLKMLSVPRTREQTLEISQQEVQECYVGTRKRPRFPCIETSIAGGKEALERSGKTHLLWILARLRCALKSDQDVPGWAGFISLIGEKPERKTTIGYYPVINHPITDYKTVQECLKQAEEATHEVGQNYVVTTFDLGACMKAFPLVWNQPLRYQQHIILVGTFHTICAYLKVIGKKMEGSGLSDIMQEAGLITSGSVNGVISGKSYDRSMHCHKVILECLERLILRKYLQMTGTEDAFPHLPDDSSALLASATGTSTQSAVKRLLEDKGMSEFLLAFEQFREDVRQGKHGKTARVWLSYMDHIWLVLSLLQAVKTNNFELYAQTQLSMADLFFSFGGHNYARYLTFFSIFLANLETSHPGATDLLRQGAFVSNISIF
ncbi:hypothetical protein ACOMHN_047881 [Nucella lapillus]